MDTYQGAESGAYKLQRGYRAEEQDQGHLMAGRGATTFQRRMAEELGQGHLHLKKERRPEKQGQGHLSS